MTGWAKHAVAGVSLAYVALALAIVAPSAAAQVVLTEADPRDGEVLDEPPDAMHLCFSEPVKIDKPEDWKFNLRTPDGTALGLRIDFRTNGQCVDVFPGYPDPPPNGIWNFEWLVHAQSDGSEASGLVRFQLGELRADETPLPRPTEEVIDEDDGSSATTLLYAAIGAGLAVILIGGFGFALARRRT